ncbi:HDOD domain-containing protein [Noviherbaspirillum sp. UKPF54]|uniref:HDOD domain-containing protein n=1 Tax=Noviherbaspirillum sp. UKPF54 TaxID=2601898 RepID=UPI0011B16F3F|nr:HDOD domain-containing protein [Noviherbaspirillum sp. UKPF54]QDZ27895.1 HDOD domain-containing protein [Noviherbaspirillum sp. UKPF54]
MNPATAPVQGKPIYSSHPLPVHINIMKKLLHRLFGRTPEHLPDPDLPDAPMTVLALDAPPAPDRTINVDTLFFPWLMGMAEGEVRDLNEEESRRLRALKRVADSDSPATVELVPRLPAVVPMLLRTLREQNVSNTQLAQQISQDAVLVAAVLRQVNSSYFRRGKPVHNIEEALAVIGQNGLRMLVAGVAFKPLFSAGLGHCTSVGAPRLWELSSSYAVACRCFAARLRVDPFEAFLAGLLQHAGIVVALRVLDQAEAGPPGELRSLAFHASFAHYARRLARVVGHHWEFPQRVVAAVDPIAAPGGADALSRVLILAGKTARIRLLVKKGLLQEDEVEACLDGDEVAACLDCYRQLREAEEQDVESAAP